MQLSLEVDNDFMDLYKEVKQITGTASESDIFKKALRGLIDTSSLKGHKLSKAEKAKIEYINETRTFIPKIVRRNVKNPMTL